MTIQIVFPDDGVAKEPQPPRISSQTCYQPQFQYPDPSFLGVPPEVRLLIFDHFVTAAPMTLQETSSKERVEVCKTRYFLQLVCRQLNNEWSPIFYWTTTIIVNGIDRPLRDMPHAVNWDVSMSQGKTPRYFESHVLVDGLARRLSNARKLHYDLPVVNGLGSALLRFFSNIVPALGLAGMLCRHPEFFVDLEEVVLCSKMESYSVCEQATPDNGLWEKLWETQDKDYFDMLQKCLRLTSIGRGGPLTGWSVIRRLSYKKCYGDRYRLCERQLVFRSSACSKAEIPGGWIELPDKTIFERS